MKIHQTGILVVSIMIVGNILTAAIPGGYSKAPVGDKDIVKAAKFAITAQEKAMVDPKDSKATKLTLVEILSAHQQVVAGINYRMKLKVKVNGTEKEAEAVVWWQAWRKPDPGVSSIATRRHPPKSVRICASSR